MEQLLAQKTMSVEGEPAQVLRARLAAIVDSAEDAIISQSPAGIITTWNAAAERIFGYSAAEAIGQPVSILIPPARADEEPTILKRFGQGQTVDRFETVRLRKDGRSISVSVANSPIRDAGGEIVGLSKIVRDLTAQKKTEEQYVASLKEVGDLKSALDEHAIVAVTDARGKITSLNDKFCAISKYSRDELLGQDHRIINSGHHPREFMRELWATIARGRVWKGEIYNRAKDGTHYWVDTTIVPFLNADGKPCQYVAIRTDITALKRAQEEISKINSDLAERVRARTAQLQNVNQELEAFCYSVSHDLRAPLRHIDGYVGLLKKSLAAALPPQSAHYMEQIAGSSGQMGRLIDNLLAFSRMGRAELRHARVDTGQLLDETLRELQEEVQGRNIVWKRTRLPEVQADRPMLRQVLINLVANAIKYTRPRNPAEIEIGCAQETGDEIVFCVRDNGVGFDMEYAGKLFGVFQRLHLDEEFEGTGIGLANVRRIVARHGGRTWAEGKVDAGAAFYFSLPKKTL